MQPVLAGLNPSMTLWPLAQQIGAAIRQANARNDRFVVPHLIKQLVNQTLRKGTERMGTVALSHAGSMQFSPVYGHIQVKASHGFIGTNPLSPELSASSNLYQDRLTLDLMYLSSELDNEQGAQLAAAVRQLLLAE